MMTAHRPSGPFCGVHTVDHGTDSLSIFFYRYCSIFLYAPASRPQIARRECHHPSPSCYTPPMAQDNELLERIAAEARRGGMAIDQEAYAAAGRDHTWPVLLGSGSLDADLGFFGRDPGRTEAETGEPFVGAGGQLVRGALWRASEHTGTPTFEESVAVGRLVFWGNTVPFKPVGNKAWPMRVKRRFAPLIRELLVDHWRGHTLITLGNEAFHWFGLAEPSLRPQLDAFWRRDDRYRTSLTVTLAGREISLHPLPHPSPLNARWHRLFPELLDDRLRALGWPGDNATGDDAAGGTTAPGPAPRAGIRTEP